MADPLSVTASIITLVEACAKVAAYIREVRDGPKERTRLLMEIISTKGILESLIATLDSNDTEPLKWSKTLGFIHQNGGPLDLLQGVLTDILTQFGRTCSSDGALRMSKSLLWPFTKKDIEDRLKIFDRQKLLLTLALENDHLALSKEIQSDTRAIRGAVAAIKADVADIRSGIDRHQESKARGAVLNWLGDVDYVAQQHDFISLRQPGTGQWLLDSEQFKAWVCGETRTLFCPGIPGAGKTILTSIVIDHLTTHFHRAGDKTVGIAYVYCNFRRQDDQKTIGLFSSLLKQLVRGLPDGSLPEAMRTLYENCNQYERRPSLEELATVIQSVAATYSRVFILVDALDECKSSERDPFLAKLMSMQEKCGFNLFTTSRFVPDITERFSNAVSMEIRASHEDVGRYVDGHMFKLPSFVRRNAGLQEEIRLAIIQAVDGMFLLAQLYLNSLIGKRSAAAVRTSLAKLPSASESQVYDKAYDEVMERIQKQVGDQEELAKQVLMWITCAKRPLGIDELREALAIEPGTEHLDQDNLPDIEDMVSVCAGLVVTDPESGVVRLVHYTTQKYFERTQARWFPDSEEHIAASCISYMSFRDFGSELCTTYAELQARVEYRKFYNYATRYWGYHAREANDRPLCLQKVLEFFRLAPNVQAAGQVLQWNASKISTYPGQLSWSWSLGNHTTALHLAAYFGLEDAVRALLQDGQVDLDARDVSNCTALSWAVNHGHETIMQVLLEKGANPHLGGQAGETPLVLAAIRGYTTILQTLHTKGGVQVDETTANGMTALCWATLRRHRTACQYLLDNGANIEATADQGFTPLFYAVLSGDSDILRLLLDQGARVDAKDHAGRTALNLAVDRSSAKADMLKLLIMKGADVNNGSTTYGTTPLISAVEKDRADVVELLLTHPSIDANLGDSTGRPPLSFAAKNDRANIVATLLGDGRVNPDLKDRYGNTPLLIGCMHGSIEAVRSLLATGAVDINTSDWSGRTPLSWAQRRPSAELKNLLLQYASDHGIPLQTPGGSEYAESTLDDSCLGQDDYTCDVCTLYIPESYSSWYHCETCCGGDFDICMECYERGARCLGVDHSLVKF